jgi:hypothetical protein
MEDFSMAKTVKKAIAPAAKATGKPATAMKAPTAKKAPATGKPAATRSKKAASPESKIHLLPASHEQIAQLAHRFWAERGHKHGHHEDDWLRAEQELRGKAS